MPRRRTNLPEDYLRWLESQLKDESTLPGRTYWDLLGVMWGKPFAWSHPRDENRAVDGMDLRAEFSNQFNVPRAAMVDLGPVTFLEVLIALSRKMSFLAGGQAPGWAWQLLGNLELNRMWDPISQPKYRRALEVMDTVINRSYSPDGTGGFFPLAWPDEDQTNIELWYQMNAYVGELHPEH